MSWPLAEIGPLVEKVSSWNPSKSDSEVEFKYIDLGSVDKDKKIVDLDLVSEVTPSTAPSRARQLVEYKDVLVATVRPNLNGVALVYDTLDGATASTGYCVLRSKSDLLDSDYLFYWVQTKAFVLDMMAKASGANYPAVSDKIIKLSKIPLPPLDEQKRIAAILDKADAIRRKRQQAINLADDFLRSVFLDMFGDPVTNPKGWDVKKLVQLCGVGSSKRVFVDDFVDSGIPFYRGTEVGKLGEGKSIEPSLFISQQHYSELKEHGGVPKVGDLLLPSICPDGRIWRLEHEHPFYFKDGRVLWIKSGDSDVNSDYLRSLLQRIFFANYSQIASGTTFAELKIVALKNLDILVPPMDKQIEFSNVMRKTMANIETLNLAKQQAEEMFNSSSQKAFAGEL